MKKAIKIFCLFALACLLLSLTVSAATIPQPTDAFFVNDYASVITQQDESIIYAGGEKLYNASGAQVVVVTVQSLEGEPIEDYAYDLANEWGLGDKEEDNGILLLLSVEDREVRVEVGSGLEGALPDSKTGRILDKYGMDYFAENDFSAGLVAVYDSLVNEVYIEYGLDPDEDYEGVEDEASTGEAVITVIIFIVLVIAVFGRRGRFLIFPTMFGRGGHGGGGFSGGGFGSSGGFGGFSGGGGGFSGGGASRKF